MSGRHSNALAQLPHVLRHADRWALRQLEQQILREPVEADRLRCGAVRFVQQCQHSGTLVALAVGAGDLDQMTRSAWNRHDRFLVERTRTPKARYSVVRRAQRSRRDFAEIALVLEDLNIGFVPGLLEARVGTISAGAHSGTELMTHPGEELVHVLSGRVTYHVDGRTIELAKGDSLHFKSDVPHRWINVEGEPAVLVWVFSDGLSF